VQASRRPDETTTVLLAKLLSGCFIMRGSQLAVLHRLDAQYIVQVHTNLLTWIAKQIGAHHSSSKKKEMKIDITFFRALIPLVASVQSRDALKMYVIFSHWCFVMANYPSTEKHISIKHSLKPT
jgi:cohesin complex subunit SA-1/2